LLKKKERLSMKKKKKELGDGYVSLSQKIGTQEDIQTKMNIGASNITENVDYLERFYDSNSLFMNIVNIPVDDAFKEGRTILEQDTKESLEAKYREFGVIEIVRKALEMARLYGGAYIYVSDGRNPNEELNPKMIKRFSVILPHQLVQVEPLNINPIADDYLESTKFAIAVTSETIDPSRMIYIDGDRCSDTRRQELGGFGLSVLERVIEEIQKVEVSSNRALNILDRLSQDVLKLDGLNDALTEAGSEEMLIKRLTSINAVKGVLSTLAIDGEDEYTNVNRSLGGIKDVINGFKELVASSSRIPYSKLFGTSSTGLNSTGENELRNYYDEVNSRIQEGKIRSVLGQIDFLLVGKVVDFSFNNLMQPSDLDVETLQGVKIDNAIKMLDAGLIEDDEAIKMIEM